MESLASDFRIAVSGWLESPSTSLIEKYCLASLSITAGNQSVCELEDLITKTVRSDIRVSAYDLAVWLISNWWRLRWEPDRKTTDCKMCHHVGAAGGGFAWPSLAFVSDGDFVLVRNEPTDPSPVAPVRYLRDVSLHVPAQAFEAAVDALVETVLGRLADLRSADSELAILVRELRAERSDPDLSGYRRMEALLGFDHDDAPGGMISELQDGMAEWGEAAVEEMVAASRTSAAGLLRELRGDLPAADSIVLPDLPPGPADSLPFRNAGRQLPWQTARDAARRLRVQWGILAGPIGTTQLADLLRVNKGMIDSGPAHASSLAAGYRDSAGGGRISILLKSKFETGRRFEIARVVGDTLVAPGRDHLLPVTNAKTSRQKFQRTFAQEFLCPWDELREFVGSAEPDDDAIEDAADHFQVSTMLIETTMVNNGLLPRDRLAA